jgi:hypothetical protein
MKNRFSLFLGFAAALLLATNVALAVQNADVAGEWLMTLSTPNGDRTMTLNIEQDGSTLTGTSTAEGQEEPSELTGTIDGNNITLNVRFGRGRGGGGRGGGGRGGGRGGAPWEGTVDGDTMSGERTLRGRGGGGETTIAWTATRQ